MSITEILNHYRSGTLVFVTTRRLNASQELLEAKLRYLQDRAAIRPLVADLYADMRLYEQVLKAIQLALGTHAEAEEQLKLRFLKTLASSSGSGIAVCDLK